MLYVNTKSHKAFAVLNYSLGREFVPPPSKIVLTLSCCMTVQLQKTKLGSWIWNHKKVFETYFTSIITYPPPLIDDPCLSVIWGKTGAVT